MSINVFAAAIVSRNCGLFSWQKNIYEHFQEENKRNNATKKTTKQKRHLVKKIKLKSSNLSIGDIFVDSGTSLFWLWDHV